MKKLIIFLLILFVSNCSKKKLESNHGLVNLDKKKDKIIVGKTNKNDVINLLGPASTTSTFDDDVWIYIESKKIITIPRKDVKIKIHLFLLIFSFKRKALASIPNGIAS